MSPTSATPSSRTSPRPGALSGTSGTARLRRWLAVDAIVTGGNALAYLAVSGPLGRLFGLESGLLLGIGALLLCYAAAVGLLAARRRPAPAPARAVVAANGCWTVASLASLLFWLDPKATGTGWIIAQAAVVAALAGLQYGALRSARQD
ncbi:hypothetical protein [Streptomyces aidingensis]|uniref:Integral membrane protein n=1 Tax=Streptomyces aidingensis TaxID=910347 RepID=A0A1I1J8S4_9ACTN|nr:hypothetical protein [Streptomyces aidingensis]SFC44987.1 hypothetical protein SAMN05421773_103327 [Streptomyces aidingensis]